MLLTQSITDAGARWFADGYALPADWTLSNYLSYSKAETPPLTPGTEPEIGERQAPIEVQQEVWASGVTYLRSRNERQAESSVADVYASVYDAVRPELFFKAAGWRVVGPGQTVRIRRDSAWNAPEPELTLVINADREIVGYTAGNDMSSRSIEGENPLYLPQAKSYDGSAALGPAIVLCSAEELLELTIHLDIIRSEIEVYSGDTSVPMMKRKFPELVEFLTRELSFPYGVFLMTGTGIVPEFPFTLHLGDVVNVRVGQLTLTNTVG